MSKNTTIGAVIAAIITFVVLGGAVVGINMNAQTEENLPTNATEALQIGGEHLSGRLEVLGYEQGTPVLIPSEEQLTSLPQSFAPTSNYVEEGEVVYTGWKVDRTEPVVEEPETPEKPELEPIKPIKPSFGCPHGYLNPVFCPFC